MGAVDGEAEPCALCRDVDTCHCGVGSGLDLPALLVHLNFRRVWNLCDSISSDPAQPAKEYSCADNFSGEATSDVAADDGAAASTSTAATGATATGNEVEPGTSTAESNAPTATSASRSWDATRYSTGTAVCVTICGRMLG